MKLVISLAIAAMLATPAIANGSHPRRGYVRSDGTFVAPSRATNPNRTKTDNYSSLPNVNPYSGKAGKVDPYRIPAPKPFAARRPRHR